jgi:hypothetical protein
MSNQVVDYLNHILKLLHNGYSCYRNHRDNVKNKIFLFRQLNQIEDEFKIADMQAVKVTSPNE